MPTIVAPPAPAPTAPPTPTADELRASALSACDAHRWDECVAGLDRAAGLDPAGDASARVRAARRAAAAARTGKPR